MLNQSLSKTGPRGLGRRLRVDRIVILIVIVVGIVLAAAWWCGLFSSERTSPYFSTAELTDEDIISGKKTSLKLRISNPGENDYDNVEIEISTQCEGISFSHGENNVGENISLDVEGGLYHGEESKLYNVDVEANLPSGWESGTAKIHVKVRAGAEITDSRTLHLTIESD